MTTKKDPLAEAAKVAFDESVDGLDAATLSRLNKARQAALAERRQPGAAWLQWAPAAVAVAAVVFVLTTIETGSDVELLPVPLAEVELVDMEILLGEENIEMLEDLDFYAWLEMQEEDDG